LCVEFGGYTAHQIPIKFNDLNLSESKLISICRNQLVVSSIRRFVERLTLKAEFWRDRVGCFGHRSEQRVTEQPPAVATTFELGCSTIIPTRTFERTFRLFAKAVVDEWINEQSRAES
jgi:hypothetical protein